MSQAESTQGRSAPSARQETALHGAVILVVAIGYILVRVVLDPVTGPLRWYATDLLAGIALPSLVALVFPDTTDLGRWARTLGGKLVLTAAAVAVWEGVVPLLNGRSTPDVLDVAAYLAGTLVQHGFVCLLAPNAREAA